MNMRRFIKRTRTTHHVDNVDQRHFVYLPPCSNAMKLADHVSMTGIDQRRGAVAFGLSGSGAARVSRREKGCWLALGLRRRGRGGAGAGGLPSHGRRGCSLPDVAVPLYQGTF